MRLDTLVRRVRTQVRHGLDIEPAIDAVLDRPVSSRKPWTLRQDFPAVDVLMLARIHRATADLADADGAVSAATQAHEAALAAWCAEIDRHIGRHRGGQCGGSG